MRVIIAGPRDLELSPEAVTQAVDASDFDVLEVVSGHADGVDRSAERWALRYNFGLRQFFPDWEAAERETGNRRAAGPIRNRRMAEYADALIVVKRRGAESAGTSSMLREAKKAGIPVHVEEVPS